MKYRILASLLTAVIFLVPVVTHADQGVEARLKATQSLYSKVINDINPTIRTVSPSRTFKAASSTVLTLKWQGINLGTSTIDADLVSKALPTTVVPLARNLANIGLATTIIPSVTAGDYYLVLKSSSNPVVFDKSTFVITITAPAAERTLSISTQPANTILGSSTSFRWTSTGFIPKVNVSLYNGITFIKKFNNVANSGVFGISNIPFNFATSSNYLFMLQSSDAPLITATTSPFTISAATVVAPEVIIPSLTVSSIPLRLIAGSKVDIQWTKTSTLASTVPVVISLVKAETNMLVSNLVTSGLTAGSLRKNDILIPTSIPTGSYKFAVTANMPRGASITAYSASTTIVAGINTQSLTASTTELTVVKGKTINTRWTAFNLPTNTQVVIGLVNTDGSFVRNLVTSGLTLAPKSKVVTIPADVMVGSYRLSVTANVIGSNSITAYTDVFTVTNPPQVVTVTRPVISSIVAGARTNATWNVTNIPSGTPLAVSLVKASDNSLVSNLVAGALKVPSITQNITIPAITPAGSYKIAVTATIDGTTSIVGYSGAFAVTVR